MAQHFAILDIQNVHFLDGVCFRVTSNVPCHLWLYWTDKEPLKQDISRWVRGTSIEAGFRWCFVVPHAVEQRELGDTLIHTFPVRDYFESSPPPRTIFSPWLPSEVVFYEPWAADFRHKYQWEKLTGTGTWSYETAPGKCTFTFALNSHGGFIYDFRPSPIPVLLPGNRRLHIHFNTSWANVNSPTDGQCVGVHLDNGTDELWLYWTTACGAFAWLNTTYVCSILGDVKWCAKYAGLGTHNEDVTALLQWSARHWGLDTDLRNWKVDKIELAHRDVFPNFTTGFTNTHIALHYPIAIDAPDIWYTFAGQIDGIDSPSRGPIVRHRHTGQDIIPNPDWAHWADFMKEPDNWERFTFGGGYGDIHRETAGCLYAQVNPRIQVGGYAYGMGLRHRHYVDALRNQNLRLSIWAKGLAYSNNDLTLRADGTGAFLLHDTITISGVWELLSLAVHIPADATYFQTEIRAYSPGYGPISTRFDKMYLHLLP